MDLDDAIFEFELMASDKCNGNRCADYRQISEWLKDYKQMLCEGVQKDAV